MPNVVKYSLTTQANTLKKGNVVLGMNSVEYGPTSATGFWNGIEVPAGGYVMYIPYSNGNGMTIYSMSNNTELIKIVNEIGLQSFTTAAEALAWTGQQTGLFLVNREYENIVTDGLVMNLDAGFTPSYPRVGTTWYNISGSLNGTLTNGPTFNSDNGGSIVFDGTDDYGIISYNSVWNYNNNITLEAWVMVTSSTSHYQGIFGPFAQAPTAYTGFNFSVNSGTGKFAFLVGGTNSSAYYVQQNTQYSLNTWYHLVGVINNGTSRLYVNGILQNDSTSMSVASAIGPFMMGKFYDGINDYYFGGRIANGKFYNRVLSDAEISQNFNAQRARFGL